MRRLVQTGLLICGVSLVLLLVSGFTVQAENSTAPTSKITKPVPAKATAPAHAKRLAGNHHQPVRSKLVERAKPTVKKPIVPPHPTAVATRREPAAPIIRVSARPAPREAAAADRLASSMRTPALTPPAQPSPSDFINGFLTEAFRVALSADMPADQRRAQLATLMTTRMDLGRILIYATHAAYQAAPAAVQDQVRLSFASFLAEAYTPRIKLAAGLAFTTSAPRPSDGGVTVATTFTKPGYPASTIDWQLEPAGNSFKIVDVSSEGVSLLEIQRSSFTSVMLNDGGLPGLLSKMDARTRELASAAK